MNKIAAYRQGLIQAFIKQAEEYTPSPISIQGLGRILGTAGGAYFAHKVNPTVLGYIGGAALGNLGGHLAGNLAASKIREVVKGRPETSDEFINNSSYQEYSNE